MKTAYTYTILRYVHDTTTAPRKLTTCSAR